MWMVNRQNHGPPRKHVQHKKVHTLWMKNSAGVQIIVGVCGLPGTGAGTDAGTGYSLNVEKPRYRRRYSRAEKTTIFRLPTDGSVRRHRSSGDI